MLATGPAEVAKVGSALNGLADRIDEVIAVEREAVADLSHRLRTPLTALRLQVEAMPDRDSAAKLAHELVEKRLAACINILSPCRSVYRWKGKTEDAEEFPMLIKTTRGRYADLEAAIRSGHPYELPEIIAVRLTGGLPAYLDWVDSETQPA